MKRKFKISKNDSLIVVDVQKDFCPGGALPVPEGDKIIPMLNKYINTFRRAKARIFATRDWHPPNHMSFKPFGGIWPPHCIQNTEGAKFHADLKLPKEAKIISKATDPLRESYSGFDGTELDAELKKQGIIRVFVGGLATDYCVKNTVLDALRLGFEAVLLNDATKGINKSPRDSAEAIEEMIRKGATTTRFSEITESFWKTARKPSAHKSAYCGHKRS
ncbi:MAG TPA: nicotinamidase [Candidatus Acidoferrum sp.]|jgi:nicotinamidase/pyrazinamidase|nr:nicotinamidase [Candidatus Acidoferrum sp.]